jgi:hypothetical protein
VPSFESSRSSIFFFDNSRGRIESVVIEQNVLSPTICFRILGHSATIERPNTYLWFVTSNLTTGTPDFIRRGVPIRLLFEGDPKHRRFRSDPLAYASQHRQAILGELVGMVLRWVEEGRPPGRQVHRCRAWAATIGGILDASGLGEFFLANLSGAEEDMDQELQDLATLAEHVVVRDLAGLWTLAGADAKAPGIPASHWAKVAVQAQVFRDRVGDGNPRARATAVGIVLSGMIGRAVPVETPAGPRLATLRRRDAGSNQKNVAVHGR